MKTVSQPSSIPAGAPALNGNSFVKVPHLFVPGKGTFYPSREIAIDQAYSANGVGLWVESYEHEGVEYFRAGYSNCWD